MVVHDQHLQPAEDGICGWWLSTHKVQRRQGVRQGQRHHVAAEQHGHLLAPALPLQELRIIPAYMSHGSQLFYKIPCQTCRSLFRLLLGRVSAREFERIIAHEQCLV